MCYLAFKGPTIGITFGICIKSSELLRMAVKNECIGICLCVIFGEFLKPLIRLGVQDFLKIHTLTMAFSLFGALLMMHMDIDPKAMQTILMSTLCLFMDVCIPRIPMFPIASSQI